jgi:hypothetical protein
MTDEEANRTKSRSSPRPNKKLRMTGRPSGTIVSYRKISVMC